MGLVVLSVLAFIAVAIRLVAAMRWPGWGVIAGGLLLTAVAGFGCRSSVNALQHWGEIRIGTASGRSVSSPWAPLDGISSVPHWVLLVSGVLPVVGGIVPVRHPTHGSTPHGAAAA